MTEYRVARKTVKHGKAKKNGSYEWRTTEIPDEAEHVKVEYNEIVGMGSPPFEAEIHFLLPMEGDKNE